MNHRPARQGRRNDQLLGWEERDQEATQRNAPNPMPAFDRVAAGLSKTPHKVLSPDEVRHQLARVNPGERAALTLFESNRQRMAIQRDAAVQAQAVSEAAEFYADSPLRIKTNQPTGWSAVYGGKKGR